MEPIEGDKVVLQLLMRAEKNFVANDVLAVHLNDAQGAMFDVPGDVIVDKGSTTIAAGTQWLQRFVIRRIQYEKTHSFGIAMYKNPAVLYDVVGPRLDWNGRRLILSKLPIE